MRTIGALFKAGMKFPIRAGLRTTVSSPWSGVLTGWSIVSKTKGSVKLDIWKASGHIPTEDDSITGEKVLVMKDSFSTKRVIQDWDNTWVDKGDVVTIIILAVRNIEEFQFTLEIE